MPHLSSLIDHKRSKHLHKKTPMLTSSRPLFHALNRTIESALTKNVKLILTNGRQNIKDKLINNTQSSKRMTYLQLNLRILPHDIYSNTHVTEYERKAFTRFRTSSHNLKIEKVRWSRITRENRKCSC